MADDKTTGRLRWASQRHPKGRPRKNTALSDVFRRLSRGPSDSRPHSGDQSSGADLEHTGQNFGGTAPDPNLPSAAGAGKTENAEENTTERRRIYFNMRLPEEETHDDGTPIHHYPRNKIRTAKYTPLTFIPKNLFLQFHNVANIYFFMIVILQIFPIFGASNPGLGAVPIIAILTVTAFKDAMEDWRRTVLDNELNNARTKTLHEWHNVNVVDEHISLWRRIKKATSRSIRLISARRKGIKTDPHELERSSTVIRLSESSVRHPDGDRRDSVIETPRASRDQYADTYGGGSNAYAMGTMKSQRDSNGFVTAPSSPRDDIFVQQSTGVKQEPSVIDPFRSTPQKAKFRTTFWKNVRVGDFILVRSDDQIPADIVVLATSDSDGACYVETKNLDGETNLKVRHALRCGSTIRSAHDCEAASFWIESEGAGSNLYSYNGVARWYDRDPNHPELEPEMKAEPVSIENLLLRGCNLKNTDWIIGVVMFTGQETRIMMNSGITPSKRSFISRSLNWNVIVNFIILFFMCLISGIISGVYAGQSATSADFFEYGTIAGTPPKDGIVTFWTCVILFQNLVPISLYISIEIVKTAQVLFIYSDVEMYYEKLDYPCVPKSWNISDDLGQIEYIFSDKTGTLTQNVMEFKKCTVNGVPYGEAYTEAMAGMAKRQGGNTDDESARIRAEIGADREKMLGLLRGVSDNPYVDEDLVTFVSSKFVSDLAGANKAANEEFMLALALCHSVITEVISENPPRIDFKAQSPDEAALVATARDMGFALTERTQRGVVLHVQGQKKEYEVLNILEFNSSRKRMSAIVRMPDTGQIVLYCKGADNVIYSRLAKEQNPDIREPTLRDLDVFATEGLRTLCIARRDLSEKYYSDWNRRHEVASAAIDEREARLEEVSDEIEQELQLLGGTAIEDRLQDGVPDAIQHLADGGIKLWVLTGDRVETAINIGFSCNLLSNSMELIVFKTQPDTTPEEADAMLVDNLQKYFHLNGTKEELKAAQHDHSPPAPTHALIIDGDALKLVLEEPLKSKFLMLCRQCKSVICCRVSPSQKALVVRMVKTGLDVMTLAIGDGANDVAMIQEAHVGVGIAGEEGRQAVMSSDYAIAQFRYLSRLVLVHGRWSYRRISEMIANFFYKNMVWTFTLFWYQIYDDWEGTYLYDYSYILLVNLVFTSLPVIFMGAFDQDVSADIAMKVPQLYMRGILRKEWSQTKFWMYMLDGLYQSAVCFFLPYFLFWKGGFVTFTGLDLNSTSEIGVFVACATITIVNLYVLMNQQHWDWLFLLIVGLSVLSVWAWTGIYSEFSLNPTFYKIAAHVFGTASFWAVTFLMIIICFIPRFTAKTIQKFYFPYDSDIIREQVRLHVFDEKAIVAPPPTDVSPSPLPSPPKKKGFLSSTSSGSGKSGKSKSRSPSPAKMERNFANDDEQPIYPPSIAYSSTRPLSPPQSSPQSETDSSEIAAHSRGHHRRSTDHTERWHSHASPMIPEIVEVR